MLLTLSNYVPEHFTDIARFAGYQEQFRLSHYCQYIKEFIAASLKDPNIDGVVLPNSCDCVRTAIDYIEKSDKYVYQLKHPTVNTEEAVRYFTVIIEQFKFTLEHYFHKTITIEEISARTQLITDRNSYLHNVYENAGSFSYGDYIGMINRMLNYPLSEWNGHISALSPKKQGKGVYVIGPFLANIALLSRMEKCGLTIMGDNLTNSKRLITIPFPIKTDTLYEDIARSILNECASPTMGRFNTLYEKDYQEIIKKDIKGVVFLCKKFCESYDYLFAYYQERLQTVGIPIIRVYTDDIEYESNTIWETFYEMI
ncbi:hypothetical protein FACS1894109_01110 [Spirochaetia bacterium]|nr:hypothetical protein FACS1894109_01110 [Spirochaetia bacterium]